MALMHALGFVKDHVVDREILRLFRHPDDQQTFRTTFTHMKTILSQFEAMESHPLNRERVTHVLSTGRVFEFYDIGTTILLQAIV